MFNKGHIKNHYDKYVYYRKLPLDSFVYLLLYIDDILITTKNKFKINKLKV